MQHLNKITIKGFKSIKELNDFELKNLNIIIGANGAGKSNLISFFKMLNSMMNNNLNHYISNNGGMSDIMFGGRKVTEKMEFKMMFGDRGFKFNLVPKPDDACAIEDEAVYYEADWFKISANHNYNNHGRLSLVKEMQEEKQIQEVLKKIEVQQVFKKISESKEIQQILKKQIQAEELKPDALLPDYHDPKYHESIYEAITSWRIYHFHDTGTTAKMRHYDIIENDKKLNDDAGNIAPFLLMLKNNHFEAYKKIINAIKLAIPFFDDFILEPRKFGDATKVNLSWYQKGSDYPMQPYHFSDGSIRFICLTTVLLQPNPPETIIIDEPELGLHPSAIALLAELIQVAASKTQVIIATQSPELINYFAIDDIITATRKNNASHFERLKENDYSEWLEDYSVGELWCKNIIQGDISYE